MFLRCDGPFGSRNVVSKDAIESVQVFQMGAPVGVGPIDGSTETKATEVWDVVIVTFIDQHKYGSYLDPEEAHEVQEKLARILDGEHDHNSAHEPLVTINGVEQKLGAWIRQPLEGN